MRKCKYCGKDVGLFCRSHKECIEKHDIGVIRLKQILKDCFQQKTDFYLKETSVKKSLQTLTSMTLRNKTFTLRFVMTQ